MYNLVNLNEVILLLILLLSTWSSVQHVVEYWISCNYMLFFQKILKSRIDWGQESNFAEVQNTIYKWWFGPISSFYSSICSHKDCHGLKKYGTAILTPFSKTIGGNQYYWVLLTDSSSLILHQLSDKIIVSYLLIHCVNLMIKNKR